MLCPLCGDEEVEAAGMPGLSTCDCPRRGYKSRGALTREVVTLSEPTIGTRLLGAIVAVATGAFIAVMVLS